MFHYINEAVLVVIVLLMISAVYRTLAGPTYWDRLLGANLLSTKIIMAIALYALIAEQIYFLDVAILYGLLGFLSTILIARFIERKGDV